MPPFFNSSNTRFDYSSTALSICLIFYSCPLISHKGLKTGSLLFKTISELFMGKFESFIIWCNNYSGKLTGHTHKIQIIVFSASILILIIHSYK